MAAAHGVLSRTAAEYNRVQATVKAREMALAALTAEHAVLAEETERVLRDEETAEAALEEVGARLELASELGEAEAGYGSRLTWYLGELDS